MSADQYAALQMPGSGEEHLQLSDDFQSTISLHKTDRKRQARDRLAMVKSQVHHSAPPSDLLPDMFISCDNPACLEFLGELLANLSRSRIRCCVHEGCVFLSQSTDQWEEHVGSQHHEEKSAREEVRWEDWNDEGRCCA
jgi:hypothetical protein